MGRPSDESEHTVELLPVDGDAEVETRASRRELSARSCRCNVISGAALP